MPYETIRYDVVDSVGIVTLDRPEVYNALTQTALDEINGVLGQIGRDSTVRAIILTGTGKGFCSGADLGEFGENPNDFDIKHLLRTGWNPLVTQIRTLEKPVVCAINGVVAGAGSSLALSADFRIASDRASFVFAAFVSIGAIPDAGLTHFLSQLVGTGKALEFLLLADAGQRVTVQQALELGIVNRVVAHDDLMSEAQALATRLAQMLTKAIGLIKQIIFRGSDCPLAAALEYEAELQGIAFRTRDFREGVIAFREKRVPDFKGE